VSEKEDEKLKGLRKKEYTENKHSLQNVELALIKTCWLGCSNKILSVLTIYCLLRSICCNKQWVYAQEIFFFSVLLCGESGYRSCVLAGKVVFQVSIW